MPKPFPAPLLLLVVSLSSTWLLVVVDELLFEFDVAVPKTEIALPEKLIGIATGMTTLASSPFPLPIP
ncbi:hypothetical protein L313_1420 [Acinetobacter haemolyticus CIP 64.3 = MTCC 9819]|nr:hypothetical protein L313_1420 [Acinetobacter haemolyticus CIP 64.3 = MTCC 9819]